MIKSVGRIIYVKIEIFGNTQTTTFECKGTRRPKSGCECISHSTDFEQKDSFIRRKNIFTALENEVSFG